MSAIKLYGDSRSGNCYKPALLMRLTGQDFEWVETDVMTQQTRKPEFLKLNPNGRVPLLQLTDGRCLAESNAMLLHLSRHSTWFPNDPWKQALTWQWLFFEQYSHEPFIAVARFITLFQGREAEEAERLVTLRERGHQALLVMEQALQKSDFFSGDQASIADIALFAYTHVAHEGGFDLDRYQAIRNWINQLERMPGWQTMKEACC